MIERTQVMDRLYLKHEVRLVDMLHADRKYNLSEDQEFMALKK